MRVGSYEVKKVDNRPIQLRWPWLQRWTIYRVGMVFALFCGAFDLLVLAVTYGRGEPKWEYLLMAGVSAGAYPLYLYHRSVMAWRAEHPNYYR
jgi:hypothetical protein